MLKKRNISIAFPNEVDAIMQGLRSFKKCWQLAAPVANGYPDADTFGWRYYIGSSLCSCRGRRTLAYAVALKSPEKAASHLWWKPGKEENVNILVFHRIVKLPVMCKGLQKVRPFWRFDWRFWFTGFCSDYNAGKTKPCSIFENLALNRSQQVPVDGNAWSTK